MTQITIRQTGDLTASPNAEISFAGEPGFAITVANPFGAAEEARLAWYFEKWLTFPFTDRVKAQDAAASVQRYGETLFAQTLHGDDRIYSRYRQAVAQGVETLFFQIVGDPAFHKLHWEALWDPDRPRPLTLDAAMIRSTVQPVIHPVTVQPSPTINLLLVTARPHGGRDVGYRTIQRPLIEMLRESQLPVRVDLVRPGTWRALVEHLRGARQQHGVGHYQIIHFDLHGALLNRRQLAEVKGVEPHSYKVRLQDRFARPDLASPTVGTGAVAEERTTAWLFFEDESSDDLDAASAEEVAGLLLDHQIPRQAQPPGGPAPLRDVDVYALPGLDAEAAANLAERILGRHVSDAAQRQRYAADPAFTRLLKLLDGSPLALEVVLSNLTRQTPSEILAALEAGDVRIDPISQSPNLSVSTPGDSEIERLRDWRTRSILQCIAYAHSNLDAEAQRLLLCLFPFTSVIWADQLENYTNHLISQSLNLPISRFPEVLRAAQEWGLLTPHELPGYLRIQPVLPYFLKTRLAQELTEVKDAIETAFRLHYADLAEALFGLFEAKDPQQRQTARVLTGVEYENLTTALHLSLAARVAFGHLYAVLGLYLDSVQDHRRGIDLGNSILAQMEQYPPEIRFGAAGSSFLRVLGDLGTRQLNLQRYTVAAVSYQVGMQVIDQITAADAQTKASWKAMTYHQLGRVAQEQRQWTQAEQHYQHALDICVEFNDRYSQARTYHQLGIVAQEQRQWTQAEQYYQHALALKIEFNDCYSQALTYRQLGNLAMEQRQFQQAAKHHSKALQIHTEFNSHYEQAGGYQNLGVVAQEQRQWEKAKAHYQQALAIYIEYNDYYRQANIYHQLGMVAEAQEQWSQAYEYYVKTLEIDIEFENSDANITLSSLRRLWQTHPEESVLPALATALGETVEAVRGWITTADSGQ